MSWCYLSYATPAEFLGAAIVKATDINEAYVQVALLGIAPEFPPPTFDGNYEAVQCLAGVPEPPDEFKNRLLTRDDLARLDAEVSN